MDYTEISAVANRIFQEPLSDLVARSNPFLSAITKKAVASDRIYIKAQAASDHAAGAIADGATVTFAGTEKTDFIAPTLDWATYISKFKVNKRAMAQIASNPGMLGQILQLEIMNAGKDLADKIAADLFAGSIANGLVGLQSMIDTANTYAGIDRSVAGNANWRGLVIDMTDGEAVPAPQELSTGFLYQADEVYFDRNRYGFAESPQLFTGVTGSKVMTRYKALMESIDLSALSAAHFVNQANDTGMLGIGKTGFMGVPFMRDANISNAVGDLDDSGRLYFLDMSKIDLCVLDPTAGDASLHQIYGYGTANTTEGLRTEIEILGNQGEFVAGYVKTYLQLATPNPAAAGIVLKNIDVA